MYITQIYGSKIQGFEVSNAKFQRLKGPADPKRKSSVSRTRKFQHSVLKKQKFQGFQINLKI